MIIVNNLCKSFNNISLIDNLSFTLDDGEGICLTGKNGCGKSTLLNLICGFDSDYEGTIYIDGLKMNNTIPPYRRNISLVMQEPVLWKYMSVKSNIEYGMNENNKDLYKSIVDKLNLEILFRKKPYELSGGEAKRISIARALLANKKHILLDEPLANVDSQSKRIIIDFICEYYILNKQKYSFIYVTHNNDELISLPFKELKL